eukprot:Gregarina_sp_Poly_1__121@NODE_1027_length_5308_cov_84_795459_g524_i2_p4_GENE_NODE_1027_length_5308_cov_84_795459_g524_i2NODE_1027_length_5308_cov_84_795459_g524_i2_p4_ORF_typecomplete_len153_score21_35_NODE_1027_length_5308_cov_84_795459_g524_i216952153
MPVATRRLASSSSGVLGSVAGGTGISTSPSPSPSCMIVLSAVCDGEFGGSSCTSLFKGMPARTRSLFDLLRPSGTSTRDLFIRAFIMAPAEESPASDSDSVSVSWADVISALCGAASVATGDDTHPVITGLSPPSWSLTISMKTVPSTTETP